MFDVAVGLLIVGILALITGVFLGLIIADRLLLWRPQPTDTQPGHVRVFIDLEPKLYAFLSRVAKRHGLDTGEYLLGKALGPGTVTTDTSPLVPAPREGQS